MHWIGWMIVNILIGFVIGFIAGYGSAEEEKS